MAKIGWAVAVTAALLALAGCGGSDKSPSSSTTSTATTGGASAGRLTETVRVSDKGKGSGRTTANPGDAVQIKTNIAGDRNSPPQRVTVKAGTGPGTTLHVTATSPGHRSRAQITSADGKPLTLFGVHYKCALPPTPTPCPAQQASGGAHGFTVAFMVSPKTGLALTATVGPVPGPPPPVAKPGALPTAAYTPTELLRAHAPATGAAGSATTSTTATSTALTTTTAALTTTGAAAGTSTSAALTPAVTVTPGSVVTMVTRLTGLPGGLPQQTTITIPMRPAKTLTVSAAVPAAHTSRATITRAGGGKLALDRPQFLCAVAPTPTFCPPQSVVVTKAHEYVVTFMASPHSPPIVFEAGVRAA
jgi:hypothetical protein